MNWNLHRACVTAHSEKNENISMNFCRKCPEIKQVTINIQCFNKTPSESIFVGVARFEFRIMTSNDQQRQ